MKISDISDIKLERFLLGELPDKEMHEITAAIKNTELKNRIERINKQTRNFQNDFRTFNTLKHLKMSIKDNNQTVNISKYLLTIVPAAAAAVIILVINFNNTPHTINNTSVSSIAANSNNTTVANIKNNSVISAYNPTDHSNDTTRIKGEPSIYLYLKERGKVKLLEPGSEAHQGDLIQIAYSVPSDCWGTILSLDGRGAISTHLPLDTSGKTAIKAGGKQLVSHSYELDDAPHFEYFLFITSPKEFEINQILEALKLETDKIISNINNSETPVFNPGKEYKISSIIIKKASYEK